jgi:hypothetical protein
MRIRLQTFSFQFAEQVLNSKLAIKQEIKSVLTNFRIDAIQLSRPVGGTFPAKSWERQPAEFDESGDPSEMNFLKERVGVEVADHYWKPFTNDV